LFSSGDTMNNPCESCNSTNTDVDESPMGNLFIFCRDCDWFESWSDYVRAAEPESFSDD